MKKLLVSILALVYLTSSMGASINLHYCMGKLRGWDLFANTSSKCATCGMDKAAWKGCCHDEQKQVHVEKDQQITATGFQFLSMGAVAIIHTVPGFPLSARFVTVAQHFTGPPQPGSSLVPVFIRNCNFRL